MPGQSFERDIVHAFNDYAQNFKVKLIAYRHIQTRYQPQLFDVLVDCRGNELYLALECKSMNTNEYKGIYFSAHFSKSKGVHQLERENNWLTLSGRNGFLVVEARRGAGKRMTSFFVPWSKVWCDFSAGRACVTEEVITSCPAIDKQGGKYVFDDVFISDLVKSLDTSQHEVNAAQCIRKWQ